MLPGKERKRRHGDKKGTFCADTSCASRGGANDVKGGGKDKNLFTKRDGGQGLFVDKGERGRKEKGAKGGGNTEGGSRRRRNFCEKEAAGPCKREEERLR